MPLDAPNSPLSPRPSNDCRWERELLEAILAVQAQGSFAAFGKLQTLPPAGLFVEGIGALRMPLGVTQARQLIGKSRQAPYGRGSETLVDTSVRNTWELDASQFEFRDPAWPAFLGTICRRVARALGIQTPIQAEIYKMLIYEEGAFFKSHTDTEKIPGMFGTLVIGLPSIHDGGDVVVKHRGLQSTFVTSEDLLTFGCWYSDVKHEVLPVTSGRRWVLTYNLAMDPALPRLSADVQPTEPYEVRQARTRAVRRPLRRWLERVDEQSPKAIYHFLDYEYTEASMSFDALKAHDFARARVLREACSELPVDIFLGLLEKVQLGACDYDDPDDSLTADEFEFHYIDEVLDEEYRIKKLVDLNGIAVSENLMISDDGVLDTDAFDERMPEKEEYEGYMGNSGPSATHWYRVSTLVIVPHSNFSSFFDTRIQSTLRFDSPPGATRNQAPGPALPQLIRYLARQCMLPQAPEYRWEMLKKLASLPQDPSRPCGPSFADLDGATMAEIAKAALSADRYAMFEQVAGSFFSTTADHDLFHWARGWLSDDDEAHTRFHAAKNGLARAVLGHASFSAQIVALEALAPKSPQGGFEVSPHISDWICEITRARLDAWNPEIPSRVPGKENGCARHSRADGGAMIRAVRDYLGGDYDLLSQLVLPKLESVPNSLSLCAGVFRNIFEEGLELARPTTLSCRKLAAACINTSDFSQLYSRGVFASHDNVHDQTADANGWPHHADLIDFFGLILISTSSDRLMAQFLSKLATQVISVPAVELDDTWMPFLLGIAPPQWLNPGQSERRPRQPSNVLHTKPESLSNPSYQHVYRAILGAWARKFIGDEPEKEGDLVRPRLGCICSNCEYMSGFLEDPNETSISLDLGKRERYHLHQTLDSAGIDCTHQTIRSREPQTLVVTKTFKHFIKSHRDWTDRRNKAAETLQQLDQSKLKLLLGDDYGWIVETAMPRSVKSASVGVTRMRRPLQQETNASTESSSSPSDLGYKRRKLTENCVDGFIAESIE